MASLSTSTVEGGRAPGCAARIRYLDTIYIRLMR